MDIRFSRDYRHNYMIIKDDHVLEDDYQIKMLTKNEISGIIQCQERMINGEGLLYYDISSKQSIKNLYDNRPLKIDDLRIIFNYIKTTINNISKFLLKDEKLILDPKYIFMDIDNKNCAFIYYPYYEIDMNENINRLINYMIDRIDNNDIKAVEAVYQLADITTRQQGNLLDLLCYFEKEFAEEEYTVEEQNIQSTNMTTVSDNENDFLNYNIDEEYEEELPWYKKIYTFILRKAGKEALEDIEDEYDNEENYSRSWQQKDVLPLDEKKNQGTVYIPWVENSEQKLYGLGHHNKYHIDLSKLPITVGKLSGAVDMVILDDSISRMHAKFLKQGSKYMLQDLNSTNGCFRNGMRLEPNEIVVIEPGDEIGLGKLKFIYR